MEYITPNNALLLLEHTIFGYVVWIMFKKMYQFGFKNGFQFSGLTTQTWQLLNDTLKIKQDSTTFSYTTDNQGNICFTMKNLLPVILRKLTDQGDLIMHKDGLQYIMCNIETDDTGEPIVQLNIKDSSVKPVSPTVH